MKKNTKPIRPNGFTLIELLTVITVIGILIALLFPMIKKGLAMAQHTGCITNVRAIASGMSASKPKLSRTATAPTFSTRTKQKQNRTAA